MSFESLIIQLLQGTRLQIKTQVRAVIVLPALDPAYTNNRLRTCVDYMTPSGLLMDFHLSNRFESEDVLDTEQYRIERIT